MRVLDGLFNRAAASVIVIRKYSCTGPCGAYYLNGTGPSPYYALLEGRRSIRRFKDEAVDTAVVERLLTAAGHAPSAHGAAPARFVVVGRNPLRQRLVDRMSECYRHDLVADGFSTEEAEDRVSTSRRRILDAPLLIVGCLTMRDMWKYPDPTRQEAEHTMAVQSVAAAVENLLLAAHAEGLGACWMCAPLFAPQIVGEVLGLPSDYEPQAFIVLGWPDETPQPRTRLPGDDSTTWLL
ncbi:MAG: nitroreductase family protein [Candidatus Thorarchaeota archaeon]|nr:nitroreductase family protein [Candidatus Thorarchaeota archaeon]